MRILLAGNLNTLPHRQQVAAVKAAFAALPFEDEITMVYYMSGTRSAANAYLKNRFVIVDYSLQNSIMADIDSVLVMAAEGVVVPYLPYLTGTGKPVYIIDAKNPIVIADGYNLSSAEVCRIRGWNVGDVVSDGIALRAIDRIEEFAVYGRLCNDNQFEFGEEQQLLLSLSYKKEEI